MLPVNMNKDAAAMKEAFDKDSHDKKSLKESIKEFLKEYPKESVKESPNQESSKAFLKELPKKSPKKSPKKAPKKSPKESFKESPKEYLKEYLNESPKETPQGFLKESLEESEKKSPKETFNQTFIKKSLEEAPKESAKETLKETPKDTLKESLNESLKETLKDIPKDILMESPKETINESPKETLNESPEETPKESLNKDSFYEETSTDILNNTLYLDATESTSNTFILSDTTIFEEFGSRIEFFQRSKEIADTFNWTVLFQPKRLPPRLERLIYWRDFTKSGLIFVGGLSILLALNRFSVMFVVPFLLLHLMLGSVTLRMFKTVMRTANIPYVTHALLDYDNLVLILSREKVESVLGSFAEGFNNLIGHLINLFLFKNACDSMHLSIFLVSLAMLGRMVNGMTMAISVFIFMFTMPKLYELNKSFVDHKLECMRKFLTTVVHKIREVLQD